MPPTAIVWGSESAGQLVGQSPPYNYWRKTYPEIVAQQSVASTVADYFSAAGYTGVNGASINQQGSIGSYHANIMDDLNYLQAYGATDVAIVDFDHGVGTNMCPSDPGIFHYQMEDQQGNYQYDYPGVWFPENGVYDTQIYWTTYTENEIKFAFISTCASADYYNSMNELTPPPPDQWDTYYWITQGPLPDGTFRSMPYAFTHRLIGSEMSSDAYYYSDNGNPIDSVTNYLSMSHHIIIWQKEVSAQETIWWAT